MFMSTIHLKLIFEWSKVSPLKCMDHSVKNQVTILEGLFLDSLFYSIALFANMPIYTFLITLALKCVEVK